VPSDADDAFDPSPILEHLARAGVNFVVIGGVAGGAHGSAFGTFDLDIAYARDDQNLERLAGVLRSLGAKLRGAPPDVPFQLDGRTLKAGANFTVTTQFGALDILSDPAGAPPYDRLRANAMEVDIGRSRIRFASLDDLIAMKEAAGRTKDRLMATEYRVLSDELRAPKA
jgi:hypothetical protein